MEKQAVATSIKICKYQFLYEIHKGSHIATGNCEYSATSRELAIKKAKEEISRRFNGAIKIVIY